MKFKIYVPPYILSRRYGVLIFIRKMIVQKSLALFSFLISTL